MVKSQFSLVLIGLEVLCFNRLSYQKIKRAKVIKPLLFNLAPRPGLEPGTCGLTVRRSTD